MTDRMTDRPSTFPYGAGNATSICFASRLVPSNVSGNATSI